MPGKSTRSLGDRFWEKILCDTETRCWLWVGARDGKGYGAIGIGRRNYRTHRVIFAIMGRVIPEAMEVDHLCRERLCCNPAHLELVDHRENILRSRSPFADHARATHCPQGHPYDHENTFIKTRPNGLTHRACRQCDRDRTSRRYWGRVAARHATAPGAGGPGWVRGP